MHNPLGLTLPDARRAELAAALTRLNLYAIEDAIYAFLSELPPLAALAPEHVIVVDSQSKRLAPGLSVGFAAAPPGLADRIATALRSGGWTASRFALDAAARWATDGTVATIVAAKRRDAATRQDIARRSLHGLKLRADPNAYHLWWELPEPWRAETFVAAAARRNIAVTPAAAFAVGSGQAPNAVRLALASPSHAALTRALNVLRSLAETTPEDAGPE